MAQITTLKPHGVMGQVYAFAPKTAEVVAVVPAKFCLAAQYDVVIELDAQYDVVIELEGLMPGCEANVPRKVAAKVTFHAGDKQTLEFTVRDGDQAAVSGVFPVFDLTGFTVQWALSRGNTSRFITTADVLKSSAVTAELEVTDAVNGVLQVKLVGADTSTIFGEFYQELQVTDGASEKVVVAVGDVVILQDVANA